MGNFTLSPRKGRSHNHSVLAFDCEGTGNENGFIMGAIYTKEGAQVFHDPHEMREAILTYKYRSYHIFAHNVEYDWGVLYQDDAGGWKLYKLDSRMIKMTYADKNNNTWTFWDTCNLTNFVSLEALGEIVGLPKLPTPEYLKAEGAAYPRREDLTSDQLEEIEAYVTRDARIVYEFVTQMEKIVHSLGGNLKCTIGSTAIDIWLRNYLHRDYKRVHPWVNELAREAFYGGRTEAFILGCSENVVYDDVHSLYPSIYVSTDYPDPDHLTLLPACEGCDQAEECDGNFYHNSECTRKPRLSYIEMYEGITKCTVHCPDMHIPLLPTRIEDRLMFVTGTFTGAWTHLELRKALELGYTVESIEWQLVSTEVCSPFKTYAKALYPLKAESKAEGSPFYFVVKLLLNSLWGKTAQRTDDSYIKLVRQIDHPLKYRAVGLDVVEWQNESYYKVPVNKPITRKDDESDEEFHHREKWQSLFSQPPYVNLLWAAYTTSAARLRLYDRLLAQGENPIYCDTDSVAGHKDLPTRDGLGNWGRVFGPTTMEVRGGKFYRYLDDNGNWKYRKAAVKSELQDEYWERGEVHWYRPRKLAEAIRDNERLSSWVKQVRSCNPRYFKRCPTCDTWEENEPIPTRPWTYKEAVAYLRCGPKVLPWKRQSPDNSLIDPQDELTVIRDWVERHKEKE